MKNKNTLNTLLALFYLSLFINVMQAQEVTKDTQSIKKDWNYLVEPYLMFPNMSGTVGLGNLPDVTSEVSSKQIFSNLKMGFMLYAEASNEKWNLNSDLLYMDLAQGAKGNVLINSGEISAKQLGWELAGLYKVKPWLEVGLGGLLNSVTSGVSIHQNTIEGGTIQRNKEISETWVDPMVIVCFKNASGKKITYSLRSEIGGFGISGTSDFAWQMQGYVGYNFSKLFQVSAGYRYIGLDYEKGTGQDHFKFDMDTRGPVVRFGFHL
jgi:hypothetical protein